MRAVKWGTEHALFMAVLVAGMVFDVKGAANVALWFAWLNIFLGLFLLCDDVCERLRARGRSVPAPVAVGCDIVVVVLMVWHGWMVTAAGWMLHSFLEYSAFDSGISCGPGRAKPTTQQEGGK